MAGLGRFVLPEARALDACSVKNVVGEEEIRP